MSFNDVVETFLNEARDLLEQLEAALLDLEARPDDRELINTTFRALHTLKGSGGMFGPPAMAAFAHELENAFERVRQDEMPMTSGFASLLLAATDHLRGLLFEPKADHGAESERLVALLQAEVGAAPAEGGQVETVSEMPGEAAPARRRPMRRFDITLRLPGGAVVCGTNPIGLLDELAALGTAEIAALTDSVPTLDLLKASDLYLGWQIGLVTEATRGAIDDVFIFVDEPEALTILESAVDAPVEAEASPVGTEPSPASDTAEPVAALPVAVWGGETFRTVDGRGEAAAKL